MLDAAPNWSIGAAVATEVDAEPDAGGDGCVCAADSGTGAEAGVEVEAAELMTFIALIRPWP